jgi:multidrug resistance efflux pump
MKHFNSGRSIAAVMVAMLAGMTWAQDKPATAPASQPAAKPANEVVVEGVLLPVDPFELKLKFKAYAGSLPIAKVAGQFATVRAGDSLLEIDPTEFKRAMASVESAAETARAAMKKVEADAEIGARADALALRQQQDALKQAEANVGYWEKIDGPHFLTQLELGLKQWRDSVEDQQDELDQLRKMYKSEELTSATADIVVKRAIRKLEQTKITQKMYEEKSQRSKDQDYPNLKQKVLDGLEQAKNQLATLQATQEQAAVTRRGAVTAARVGLEQAEEKLRDMKEDEKLLAVKSPVDGVVVYGTTGDGGWQGGDPKGMKASEKLAAGATALRVITLGKMRVEGVLKEDVGFNVREGMKAKVTLAVLPGVSYEGVCAGPVLLPKGSPATPSFVLTVNLPEVDKRLLPGMKATVKVELGGK